MNFNFAPKSQGFLFKYFGFEIHLKSQESLKFAELVNNGSSSLEFLNLARVIDI